MKKIFFITTLFFWSMFFPSLSFNNFTCELTNTSSSYLELLNRRNSVRILENAEYKFGLLSK